MAERTVLFYGTPGHATLELLYQATRQRGRRRAVFLVQEQFPGRIGICLGGGADDPAGRLEPPYEEPIDLDDVCGVCLDGFYVDPGPLASLPEEDAQYVQTEAWATLIALFGRLARRPDCVVANHFARRERLATRAAQLTAMAAAGLPVPPMLVTSAPEAARAFFEAHGERTLFRPVGAPGASFQRMTADDLERLDAIRLAPAHFEAELDGPAATCAVIGEQGHALGAGLTDEALAGCLRVCRSLGLTMAEITLRAHEDRWVATSLSTHLTPASLSSPAVLEAAVALLEGPDTPVEEAP